ncbi:hypothetical protein C0J52_15643, partial [Blattella germanica]
FPQSPEVHSGSGAIKLKRRRSISRLPRSPEGHSLPRAFHTEEIRTQVVNDLHHRYKSDIHEKQNTPSRKMTQKSPNSRKKRTFQPVEGRKRTSMRQTQATCVEGRACCGVDCSPSPTRLTDVLARALLDFDHDFFTKFLLQYKSTNNTSCRRCPESVWKNRLKPHKLSRTEFQSFLKIQKEKFSNELMDESKLRKVLVFFQQKRGLAGGLAGTTPLLETPTPPLSWELHLRVAIINNFGLTLYINYFVRKLTTKATGADNRCRASGICNQGRCIINMET